jgi:hypothetical protein
MQKPLLSRKELLELLPGLTNSALAKLMKDRRIPFVQISREAICFDAEAVLAALTVKEKRQALAPEMDWSGVEAIEAREKQANAIIAKYHATADQIAAAARDAVPDATE